MPFPEVYRRPNKTFVGKFQDFHFRLIKKSKEKLNLHKKKPDQE